MSRLGSGIALCGITISAQMPCAQHTMAHLRFPGRGGVNLLFGKCFARKLHENERNWPKRGGAQPWRPMDPPMCFTAKGNYQSLNILAKHVLRHVIISKVLKPLNGTRTPVTDRLSTLKQSSRCIATESLST